MKIIFEDQGQDFIVFVVNENTGKIIDSRPFQSSIWTKYKVTNVSEIQKGKYANLLHIKDNSILTIKYPIEKIIL